MNDILKQAREVYKNREEQYYLETIRKTADELEATKKRLQDLERDVEFIIRKMSRIRGFKAEYNRNLDFSIVYERLLKVGESK